MRDRPSPAQQRSDFNPRTAAAALLPAPLLMFKGHTTARPLFLTKILALESLSHPSPSCS